MIQLRGFLGRLIRPLLKAGLPLVKNALKRLAKCVLVPLGLKAAASVANAAIQKRIFRSGTVKLIFQMKTLMMS